MTAKKIPPRNDPKAPFRIGRVRVYLRGKIWYLDYHEQGRRRQPRVGPNRVQARRIASEINAQLEMAAPSAFGFEPATIPEVRQRWLDYHEYVRRSALRTLSRYRSATRYLIDFTRDVCPVRRASDFQPRHAQDFVRYLRSLKVAPNGHAHTRKRALRDGGIKFVLETCSTLFNFAKRNRHLSPYADNPFLSIEIGRMPVEDARPIVILTPDQEQDFLEACDDWQLPLFLTLLMTGLRPGELSHVLLPDDVDLDAGWLYIRNKPELGWKVKTRNERDIPLYPALAEALRIMLGSRRTGPLFRQRRCADGYHPPLESHDRTALRDEIHARVRALEVESGQAVNRVDQARLARTVWRDLGAVRTDSVRLEFMQITKQIGLPHVTAPKTTRHTFATTLQDANVDPLIRNELMGHMPAAPSAYGVSLAMTTVYTHTRPETKRRQLEGALRDRPAAAAALRWLAAKHGPTSAAE